MDLLTHALLGAALGAAVSSPLDRRKAAAVGSLAALLPDGDVFLGRGVDDLAVLEWHRHFTHSLLVAPLVALLAAGLFALLGRFAAMPSFPRLVRAAILPAFSAGLLDSATSYGTHLLWPFSGEPVAFSIVAVVDPLVTAVLFGGLVLAWRRGSARPAQVAVLFTLLYLAFGALQRQRAEAALCEVLVARGHGDAAVEAKPTLGNVVLWRTLYRFEGRMHADAVHVGFGAPRVYAGASAPLLLDFDGLDFAPPGSGARRDLERFQRLSQGWLVQDPRHERRIGDGRYAMSPVRIEPLWGVEPLPSKDGLGLAVERNLDPEGRKGLLRMLLGRPLEQAN